MESNKVATTSFILRAKAAKQTFVLRELSYVVSVMFVYMLSTPNIALKRFEIF